MHCQRCKGFSVIRVSDKLWCGMCGHPQDVKPTNDERDKMYLEDHPKRNRASQKSKYA